jgi:hypothetical protein
MALDITSDLFERRYGDRGGRKGLEKLFAANLPYEVKIANAKEQYRVSTNTATDWYAQWRGAFK